MVVRQRKDGRWIVYYRIPEGKKGVVNEYFGRGPEGKLKALQRDSELGLKTRRPSKTGPKGPTFFNLSVLYMKYRGFKSRPLEQLKIRLTAIILPRIGHKRAVLLSDDDMDGYVAFRRRTVKDNSIARELTIKAILSTGASSAGRR
ncbi:MAG: hypothetical protein KQI81_05900 [Deltaproteobacteria bacterium]|nr:hypothetical protein [Deltaproteobacteria bacterium]